MDSVESVFQGSSCNHVIVICMLSNANLTFILRSSVLWSNLRMTLTGKYSRARTLRRAFCPSHGLRMTKKTAKDLPVVSKS